MATAIEITITANDRASQALQGVRQQLGIFDQFGRLTSDLTEKTETFTRSVEGVNVSVSRTARGVRALAVPLVSELSPALGTTASRMATVVTGAIALGGGLGVVALAAAGLAGIVGGQLVQSWRGAQQSLENFQRAMRSTDLGVISGQIRTQSDELERLRDRLNAVNREIGAIDPRRLAQLQGPLSPAARRGRLVQESGDIQARIRDLEAQEGLQRAGQEELAGFASSEALTRRFLTERATQQRTNELAQRGLFDFQLEPIERQFQGQLRQADDLARAGDTAAADRLRRAARTQRDLSLGQRFQAGAPEDPFGTTAGQDVERRAQGALLVAGEEARLARIAGFQTGAPVSPFETAAGQEAERRAVERFALEDEQDRIAKTGAQAQLAAELFELERKRLEIAGQLTPELSAQLTQLQAAAIASDERLTPEQQALALAQAQVAVWQDLAALDPLQGLITGFSRVANESRQLGTELERFARETGSNMERAFSDTFFDAFTGKKGEDIGKRFGESLLRSFTDLLGRQLSGAASGLFAQALGGFRAVVPGAVGGTGGGGAFDLLNLFTGAGGGGAIVSPTGPPAGSVIQTAQGLAQVTPSGALQLVQGAQGGGGVPFDVSTVLGGGQQLYSGVTTGFTGLTSLAGNYAIGGITGALFGLEGATVGGATVLGSAGTTGFLAAEVAATGTGTAVGASAGSTGLLGTGGTAFASTLGAATAGVLAGVALGFTIYGGLTQEATAQNIAINAISGAVSGAILGAVVGSFIAPGVGTVIGGLIGAIAGGAAAGGTTGLKAPKKISTSEKSGRIGEAGAGNLKSAIDSAASIEDLVAIFNTRWAPHGEVQLIVNNFQGVYYFAGDFANAAGALATPEVMVVPEFLDTLDIRVGPTGVTQTRQDLIEKFRGKRDEVLGILSNIPFEILESDRAAGVTRRTQLPFRALYGLQPGTQQLRISSELLRRDLGAEEETIAFLLDRIREMSVRKDIDISRTEFLFR